VVTCVTRNYIIAEMSLLSIYAGPTAYRKLQADGFHVDQFGALLGASGGPKWFVLYGLDRYLFGEFLVSGTRPLDTLGSSAGAWRLSCLATADPLRAIDALAVGYSEQTYSAAPSVTEITDKMRDMLALVLGTGGASEIVSNERIRTHIIADRCKGIGNSSHKAMQMGFLGLSALANTVSRRALSLFFQRTLFTPKPANSPWGNLTDLDTRLAQLTANNLLDVLIASGSIPFVLSGVRNIEGAHPGMYWDGGITDYHFDFPFHRGSDLVLYPHFSATVIPGWFDKHLPWRKPHRENFDNVVLLAPSAEFVNSLPNRKIPDRTDFEAYPEQERLRIWREVLASSQALGDAFARLVQFGEGLDNMVLLDQF